MPGTPSVRQDVATTDADASRQAHTTCPPEEVRDESWGQTEMDVDVDVDVTPNDDAERAATGNQQLTPQLLGISRQNDPALSFDNQQVKKMDIDEESPAVERLSPDSMEEKQEVKSGTQQSLGINNYIGSSLSMDYEFSNVRLRPSSPSSYLRAGSKFHGTQQSERQVYEVQVEIKHVDMRESFLCGYLRIQGLTEDHPTLTTYFEGEIIGSKYSFLTKHEDWGSTDKVDLEHWAKFQAFRPFQKQARKGNLYIPNVAQRENIFMRWKEHFLLPDHRVRTISGASFEGFYYICFNQCQGTVSGIYFHAKSEKFQQLELKHVEDRGTFGAMEFR